MDSVHVAAFVVDPQRDSRESGLVSTGTLLVWVDTFWGLEKDEAVKPKLGEEVERRRRRVGCLRLILP